MSLTKRQIMDVENVLKNALRHKFQNYKPEPAAMPFHSRLLGGDRMALFSFIHSLNTNFGTSIFEPIAISLAKSKFKRAESQVIAGDKISSRAQMEIQNIMDALTTAKSLPNKQREIEIIKEAAQQGEFRKIKSTKVDVLLESHSGELFLFDIKTAKPNAGGFKEFKRTLLEWTAAILSENPEAKVQTLIAIPYNPYDPEPYNRWTIRGMLDLERELKVANEFWDFLGGQGAYDDLLKCFERVGIELRNEIDAYFAKYNKRVLNN